MVDLGFLLITFFMITTTMAKPKVMDINMPDNQGPPTTWIDTCTITLIPVKDHKVVYYNGSLSSDEQLRATTIGRIRGILLGKKRDVAQLPASYSTEAHKLHVLMKPNDDCKYEDIVHLLDELNIADAIYTIVDLSDEEKTRVSKAF
jgi:biopolymer transport protein ExbD